MPSMTKHRVINIYSYNYIHLIIVKDKWVKIYLASMKIIYQIDVSIHGAHL